MTSNLKDLIYFAEVNGSSLTLSVEGVKELKQDLERLEETEKALVETYELNASLRKQVEELEANLKHLNINYKTALKVNNDLLNENRKLKEKHYVMVLSKNNTYSGVMTYHEFCNLFVHNKDYNVKCIDFDFEHTFTFYKICGMNSTKLKQMIEEYIC